MLRSIARAATAYGSGGGAPHHEEEVELGEVVRGYEYSKDQYVVMEPSDFDSLPIPSTHTIEIAQFIELSKIDPMHFERGYVLEPEAVGQKPFYLLKRALEASDRVAIAKVSLRQKEHLCCLRPYGRSIAISTMFYADELRAIDELDLPEDEVVISDQEMAMANTLIDQLAGSFEPEQHHDEYRSALERVIEAKLGVAEAVAAPAAPAAGKVVDLMDALKASIQATKKEAQRRQPARVAETDSAAPSKKKAVARKAG